MEWPVVSPEQVKVIVRSSASVPDSWNNKEAVSVIKANIAEVSEDELANFVKDCDAVACCLGHNLTWKGIFGKPRKLVTDTVRSICDAIERNRPGNPDKDCTNEYSPKQHRDLTERLPNRLP